MSLTCGQNEICGLHVYGNWFKGALEHFPGIITPGALLTYAISTAKSRSGLGGK